MTSLLLTAALLSFSAQAQVLFESFYRIEREGKHTGYAVQRVAVDSKTSQQTVTTYVRLKFPDNREYFESFKSVAKGPSQVPVAAFYRGDVSGGIVDVQSRFVNGAYNIQRRNAKGVRPFETQSGKIGTKTPFLNSFLFYVTDFSSLKAGRNYTFDTFVDRDGVTTAGNLSLQSEKTIGGVKHSHVVVDTTADPVESFVSAQGFPLGSRSPVNDLVSFHVGSKEQAVGSMQYPNAEVIALFGDLPEGKKNPWSEIKNFDAYKFIGGFRKSFGTRKLASVPKQKISQPLPLKTARRGGR